jgi:hypothetical protein
MASHAGVSLRVAALETGSRLIFFPLAILPGLWSAAEGLMPPRGYRPAMMKEAARQAASH